MMTNRRQSAAATVAVVLFAAGAGLILTGCRGDRTDDPPRQFFPGLDDQAKYKPQSESGFFADGRTMREPPAGTVAFSRMAYGLPPGADDIGTEAAFTYGSTEAEKAAAKRRIRMERASLLRNDEAISTGRNAAGEYIERIPVHQVLGYESGEEIPAPEMRKFLNVGREQYRIFCYTCHGVMGDGQGPVGAQWSGVGAASLLQDRLLPGGENGQDGYMFSIGYFGLPNTPGAEPAMRMPAYKAQLSEYEMWAITAYIRALQASQNAELQDVPEVERDRLLRNRPQTPIGDQEGQG